jgi:hypothetical protein
MQLGNFSVSLAVKDIAASRAFYDERERSGNVPHDVPPRQFSDWSSAPRPRDIERPGS